MRHVHGISSNDYKDMYGLPWGRGLIGTLTRKKKRKIGKRLLAEGKVKLLMGEPINRIPDRRPFQRYERERSC